MEHEGIRAPDKSFAQQQPRWASANPGQGMESRT